VEPLTSHPTVAPVVRFLEGHPVVLPLLLLAVTVAWFASRPLGRRIGRGRGWTALLVLAGLVPLAMTLPPTSPDPGDDRSVRSCITALRPLAEWGRGGEELANVLLLAPFGFLVVLLLGRGAALLTLLVAAVFPVVVELTQYAVPALGRLCETTDAVLNLVGLTVGATLGLVLRLGLRLRPARRAPGPRRSASPGT
jgi:VanZ family protein